MCHLSSRTRAVLEVASLIWSVDRAQGCDRNHHNIQRRAHAQTLLVDENDGQVGSPHACNARSAIDPEDWIGYHRQCMHATRKKMKPLACLLVVVSYGAPAGRPAAVTCCASHGWAGISGRGACVLLGRRRRSVSVALAAPACGQHVPVPCPRSTSSSARQVPVVWTHGHASALACMHHACRSSC